MALLDPTDTTIDWPGPSPEAPLALVAEESFELRTFICDVLSARYRVKAVTRGSDVVEQASKLTPAVIVCSLTLPDLDGYVLCRQLRSRAPTRAIPIIVITDSEDLAIVRHDTVREAFEAGANDFVAKPLHGRELLARVDVHVGMRKMAQGLALSERHAMLGVMAASIAHQVRNPLTTLVAGLPAMRARMQGRVDVATTELVDVMVDCTARIERLTRDLMDISRVDHEPNGTFNPSDGLRSAIRLAKARVIGIAMIEDDVRDGLVMEGRAGDINHVFLNLLDNAIRAIGEGGRVRVVAAVDGSDYVVRVDDSGQGVALEIADRIFEPFFTTRPIGEGTGLGLAIARQIVNQHGGEILLGRSELGGALFTVRLPLEAPRRASTEPGAYVAGASPWPRARRSGPPYSGIVGAGPHD